MVIMNFSIYKIAMSYSSFIRGELETLEISCYLKGLLRHFHLIELALCLPVATIIIERDFPAKNIIKIELFIKQGIFKSLDQ
jgi:hypothetical protein